MTTSLLQFGLHILKLRQRAGLSQEALAARANLSRHYISELESGNRNPSLEVLIQLAWGLNTPLSEVVDFEPSVKNRQ